MASIAPFNPVESLQHVAPPAQRPRTAPATANAARAFERTPLHGRPPRDPLP